MVSQPAEGSGVAFGRGQPRGGRENLASLSAFSITGMPAGSPALHFSTPVRTSRPSGCWPLLESMSRYCSYLVTNALQYSASLDWANAAIGTENRAAASRVLM